MRHIARSIPAVTIAAIGIVISVLGWTAIADWERRTAEVNFKARASNMALILQGGINEYIHKIVALRAHFIATPATVGRGEFEAFASELIRGQEAIRSVSWIPRVGRDDRAAHEKSAIDDGILGYHIQAVTPAGVLMRSAEEDEYFPIFYRSENYPSGSLYGLDLGDGGPRQSAIERARDTNQLVASQIIPLQAAHPSAGDRRGFVVLLPVYKRGAPQHTLVDRRRNLLGFVEGAFHIATMARHILGDIDRPVDLYAVGEDRGIVPIFVHDAAILPTGLAAQGARRAAKQWSGALKVADTTWTLAAYPASGSIETPHTASWIVLLAGLLLTGATSVYVWTSGRYALGLVHANERISALAKVDPLTSLANRRTFSGRLAEVYASTRQTGAAFAVLYFDLDDFKDVNDTLGHAVGDALLRHVSERLKTIVRDPDLVARFGGDEFAVLLCDMVDPAAAQAIADRIVEALGSPYVIAANQVRVTASVGISYYSPDIAGPESMMMQADLALYRAKEDGRNCARFHTGDLDVIVKERVSIADDLHRALEQNELALHYQPQVELASGRIVGFEALVRWNHPKRGVISPASFIPIAERSGLILPLGRWIMNEACRQTRLWHDLGIAPDVVAINISAVQCKRSDVERDMAECIERLGLDPHRMEVELTESVLMEATQNHRDIVARLRRLGLRIAIDDFGTGYSSLSYLTNYPVDRLKIAQELMLGVATDKRKALVVKTAIGLSHDLGIEILAEGVETEAQVHFLVSAGCTLAQGYYFSGAVSGKDATELLRRGGFGPRGRSHRGRLSVAKASV